MTASFHILSNLSDSNHLTPLGTKNGRQKMRTKVLLENLKGRYCSGYQGVGKRMILKWISEKLGMGCGLDSSGSGQEPAAD
jgi:hypothetical protein